MRSVLASAAATLLLLTGCGSAEQSGNPVVVATGDNGGYHGSHLTDPWQPSDLVLETDAGASYDLSKPSDKLRVVFFGYTKCPDICQVVMGTIASAVNRLEPEHRERVEVAFVTTDPARDTPKALRAYLDGFDPAFVGVTGPLERIVEFAKPLKVHVEQGTRLPSGGYEVNHGTAVIGLYDGGAQLVWTQGTTPPDLAEDIERLLEENA